MEPQVLTTTDLLNQWREATRAAELAERLATIAAESVEHADDDAAVAVRIAELAEEAAKSAARAAEVARSAADRAVASAAENRDTRLPVARQSAADARSDETEARDAYHEGERHERERYGIDRDGAGPRDTKRRNRSP